jgi:hypothetical protein
LNDSGDELLDEIVTVTPQRVHSNTGSRGYRVDVEGRTVKGNVALLEVQLSPFKSTIERSLIYAEQPLIGNARRGDTLKKVTAGMPRVIVVNILDFILRKNGRNFHQVAELTYREAPQERATDRFEIHALELPKFRELEYADMSKPLHCWLTAICEAQELG